jgi:hypothetical protein
MEWGWFAIICAIAAGATWLGCRQDKALKDLERRLSNLARLVPSVVSAGVSAVPQGERVHGERDPDPLDTTAEHDLAAARHHWRIIDRVLKSTDMSVYGAGVAGSTDALRHLLGDKPTAEDAGLKAAENAWRHAAPPELQRAAQDTSDLRELRDLWAMMKDEVDFRYGAHGVSEVGRVIRFKTLLNKVR